MKYLRVVDPEPPAAPTITEVRQYGSSEANLISNMGGDVTVSGANLAGARVYWTYTDPATSEPTTVEVEDGFLNVSDTSIAMTPSGVAQIGLMDSGDVVLKVTTPGGTAEQACRFSYE